MQAGGELVYGEAPAKAVVLPSFLRAPKAGSAGGVQRAY